MKIIPVISFPSSMAQSLLQEFKLCDDRQVVGGKSTFPLIIEGLEPLDSDRFRGEHKINAAMRNNRFEAIPSRFWTFGFLCRMLVSVEIHWTGLAPQQSE